MKKLKNKKIDFINIAAIFVTIASLLSSVSWIGSSNAGGEADDLKTAALEASRQAGLWLNGTIIHSPPLRGSRR
jgi:hypothetical protein